MDDNGMRMRYHRRDSNRRRPYFTNARVNSVHYVADQTRIGIREVSRSAPTSYQICEPQSLHRIQIQSESEEGSESQQYSFNDFPIDMDDSEVIVSNKFSVSLLHQPRFNAIFIRVRWQGMRDSVSICAILEFGSSESLIRNAVEECAGDLQRRDYYVRCGDRYPVSHCSVAYLNTHHIVVMDKVDENFPNAVYWCTLCDYHMSSIQHVRSHFEQHDHFADEQRMKEKRDLIEALPEMCDGQLEAINSAIRQLESSIEGEDLRPVWEQRLDVATIVESLLKINVFEKMRVRGHVRVYGSTITKTAIASSDLNLTIDIPDVDCSDAVETMKHVADLLNQSTKGSTDGFEARFVAETPMCIRLTISNVLVRITWRRENGIKLGSLLSTYAAVRPQYAELCRVVRRWAQICGIYSVERRQGGLTSYAFDLMLLYFLQQKGLLPCLHEMRPMMVDEKRTLRVIDDYFERKDFYENNVDKINEKFETLDEPWNLAQLFVEFLQFFGSRLHQNEVVQVVTKNVITRDKTRWSRKLMQIADPYRTDNVVTFTKAYQVYFFNCFFKSYLYFAIPQTTEGPLVDVTLYQKMGESPRKKKGKRRRATNGNAAKQQTNEATIVEKPVSKIIESIANFDVDEEEYTAAADAVADEEQKTEIGNQIMDNLMPVPKLLSRLNMVLDARAEGVEAMDTKKNLQHFSIACLNGFTLKENEANNVMEQLVATAEAVKSTGGDDALLGCFLVDLPDELCGSYMLPEGKAFFVPKQSACGIFVRNDWISRMVDVVRQKKGIYEITLRLSKNQRLKLLLCKEFCQTYPLRRLKERVEKLKTLKDTSIIVLFSSEKTSERTEIELAEECEALGLDVWTGLIKDELRTLIATMCKDDVFVVEDLIAEEVDYITQLGGCYVVRAVIKTSQDKLDPREELVESTMATVERVAEKMEASRRKKEKKLRQAERRRREKKEAAQLLESLKVEEKSEFKESSPHMQFNEAAMVVDNLVAQGTPSCLKTGDNKKVVGLLSAAATPSRSAVKKRNRKRKTLGNRSSTETESNETILKEGYLQASSSTSSNDGIYAKMANAKEDDALLKNVMENSLVHGIRLKDLNPQNVEIDDDLVYSRRTMYRIRRYEPISIPRATFGWLERLQINSREFEKRDKEVDEMKELRRENIRNERLRSRLRAVIGEENEEKNEKTQIERGESDLSCFGDGIQVERIIENDWLPQVQNDEDETPDITIDSIEAAELPENEIADEVRGTVEQDTDAKQLESENALKPLICYEDFFITVKKFDIGNFKAKIDCLNKDSFIYSFDVADNFNSGYKPDMVCASCESSEHWSDACPLMTIPTAEPITHEKKQFEWTELDQVILGTYERNRVKESRIEQLGKTVDLIRAFLQNDLHRRVRLDIFGSLVNGLGAGSSDVDICFRFETDEQPLNVDGVEIVKEISQSLQKMKGLEKVYAITGAKVPIVKFVWPKYGFEGDISYYNVLALYNTQLLRTYCSWDRRVAPLGIWVKRWAKSCDIGDASRGSLSSYAVIILLIHYLQNCEPPVLPRLQEDFRSGKVEPMWVENHDVYYYQKLPNGDHWSTNNSSVSQLFVGFLDYYAQFDFDTLVVQIRRKKPLLKMEKDWNRSLCIEDPFDLNHNLGSGVTKKMYVFIARNIHNSRRRFMLSDIRREYLEKKRVSEEKEMTPNLIDQYAATLLKECEMGLAPTDRQCRICHKVGHFAESCPRNQHVMRTLRREPWSKKAPIASTDSTPRAGPPGGRRYQVARHYFQKVDRPQKQNGLP